MRNFDLQTEEDGELQRMIVSGFLNYDEALQYARKLYAAEALGSLLPHCRSIIISQQNLALIGSRYSYNDYADFYQHTFQPLQISNEQLLTIPEGLETPDPEDGAVNEDEDDEDEATPQDGGGLDFGEDFW